MFVDLDWPLNASSLLSASAELLVLIDAMNDVPVVLKRTGTAFPCVPVRLEPCLYDIRPGNGAGQFLQHWSPHGADPGLTTIRTVYTHETKIASRSVRHHTQPFPFWIQLPFPTYSFLKPTGPRGFLDGLGLCLCHPETPGVPGGVEHSPLELGRHWHVSKHGTVHVYLYSTMPQSTVHVTATRSVTHTMKVLTSASS